MSNLYPIKESDAHIKWRENSGGILIRVNAKKFKEVFEQHNQEPLPWNPSRLQNLRNLVSSGIKINAHPRVGLDAMENLSVGDGRHRISHAAERDEDIEVEVEPSDKYKIETLLGNNK